MSFQQMNEQQHVVFYGVDDLIFLFGPVELVVELELVLDLALVVGLEAVVVGLAPVVAAVAQHRVDYSRHCYCSTVVVLRYPMVSRLQQHQLFFAARPPHWSHSRFLSILPGKDTQIDWFPRLGSFDEGRKGLPHSRRYLRNRCGQSIHCHIHTRSRGMHRYYCRAHTCRVLRKAPWHK